MLKSASRSSVISELVILNALDGGLIGNYCGSLKIVTQVGEELAK
jgi:hypothetical protein